MTDMASQILAREEEERQTLELLLERHLGRGDKLLVQKTQMGNTTAFMGTVTLEWLSARVGFASELPLFQQKFDPRTENPIRNAETIDEILQRPLDWSRQASLALYLAVRKTHKFPALLVVVCPPWVDDPISPEWDNFGRARCDAVEFLALDKQQNLGLLDVANGVPIFALDGQHRLMGVQGLMSLIKSGRLQRYNKNKTAVGSPVTTENLRKLYHVEPAELQKLAFEKIGVEFIPAVMQGETREEARRRVRSIFVHVNLMAVQLSQGQLALLNEDDGFAIVARQIAVQHPLFKDKSHRNPRVNWDSATVAAKSTVLTTLQAMKDMSTRYLCHKFPHWKPAHKQGSIPMRPDDAELEEGLADFKALWDGLAGLLSYQKLELGEETPQMRRFSFENPGGDGNILFRPVGQVAVVQALGILVFQKGFSLRHIFEKLNRYDADGGFSGMEHPGSLWYGVLYDPNKKRVRVSGRDLASRLLVYLLGGMDGEMARGELRSELAKARTFEDKAVGFDGKLVLPQDVGIPPML